MPCLQVCSETKKLTKICSSALPKDPTSYAAEALPITNTSWRIEFNSPGENCFLRRVIQHNCLSLSNGHGGSTTGREKKLKCQQNIGTLYFWDMILRQIFIRVLKIV